MDVARTGDEGALTLHLTSELAEFSGPALQDLTVLRAGEMLQALQNKAERMILDYLRTKDEKKKNHQSQDPPTKVQHKKTRLDGAADLTSEERKRLEGENELLQACNKELQRKLTQKKCELKRVRAHEAALEERTRDLRARVDVLEHQDGNLKQNQVGGLARTPAATLGAAFVSGFPAINLNFFAYPGPQ